MQPSRAPDNFNPDVNDLDLEKQSVEPSSSSSTPEQEKRAYVQHLKQDSSWNVNAHPVTDKACQLRTSEQFSSSSQSNFPQMQIDKRSPKYFPRRSALSTYLFKEIAHDYLLEAQMLALTVVTGIVDAATFTQYSLFVSKQTGNVMFMALYAIDHPHPEHDEFSVLVSFFLFLCGAGVFGHVGHHVKQRCRIWLVLSNFVQTVLVYGAAAVRYWAPDPLGTPASLGAVALLSFAFGGQISLAVHAGLADINTTMITGALCQLATDRKLLWLHNVARNRRILFVASLLVGCFVGSATTKLVDASLALLLAAITKTLVGVSFFFNDGVIPYRRSSSASIMEEKREPFMNILWGD